MTPAETLKKAIEIIDQQKSAETVAKAISDATNILADLQANISEQNRKEFITAIQGIKLEPTPLTIDLSGITTVLQSVYEEMQKPCEITVTLQLE